MRLVVRERSGRGPLGRLLLRKWAGRDGRRWRGRGGGRMRGRGHGEGEGSGDTVGKAGDVMEVQRWKRRVHLFFDWTTLQGSFSSLDPDS